MLRSWAGATAASDAGRTVANTGSHPQARVAVGDTMDVVMVDTGASLIDVPDIDVDIAERYAEVSTDPRAHPADSFVFLRLQPRRIQVWNGVHEFSGRTVMTDLSHPRGRTMADQEECPPAMADLGTLNTRLAQIARETRPSDIIPMAEADSYVIRDGLIVAQTISCAVDDSEPGR